MLARTKFLGTIGAAAMPLLFTAPAWARIKVVTLPKRERVELQLDNPHATLVEEERVVALLKGANQIDFSWANTGIDKDTIVFRPINMADKARVISVSYPPGESALVWQVFADEAGPCRVRISYLIQNLNRSFSYRATATHDESELVLRNSIRLDNFSGEHYDGAGVWAGFGPHVQKAVGVHESKEMLQQRFD
jgi:hypothetical protein